ncbi:protein FAM229A isoform X2 [Globicephala melas]|uniref:protein FAM229A isoform X2 n=1 Tax=Globicephala melas TaxID=9731 RepID=UPI00293D72DC|nr:protein FAM229A isoform X2 [Globicephala melas]
MQPSPSTPGPRARRRHLPGSAWTGASSRGQGSGSYFLPGTGLGLRQSASDMSAQEPPQGRRFPIEAGDSPGLAFPRETQDSPERVATEHNPVRMSLPRLSAPCRGPLSPGRFDAAPAATA